MLESFAHLATIIGAVSLLFALLSWRGARNSFHHAVIISCTTRFQQLSFKLSQRPLGDDTVQQYLDLCNEEAFYFESNYLPQAITDEWVDGMLSFIQLRRDDDSIFQLPSSLSEPVPDLSPSLSAKQLQLLNNYPRLKHAFRLSHQAEQAIIHVQQQYGADAARAQMVLTVLGNIQTYKHQPFLYHLYRSRAESW